MGGPLQRPETRGAAACSVRALNFFSHRSDVQVRTGVGHHILLLAHYRLCRVRLVTTLSLQARVHLQVFLIRTDRGDSARYTLQHRSSSASRHPVEFKFRKTPELVDPHPLPLSIDLRIDMLHLVSYCAT